MKGSAIVGADLPTHPRKTQMNRHNPNSERSILFWPSMLAIGALLIAVVSCVSDVRAQMPRTYGDPQVPTWQAPQRPANPYVAPTEVVLFSANWCAACPPSKALAAQHGVRVIDFDAERGLAAQYGVRLVPTWLVIADGRVTEHFEGTPSVEELRRMLRQQTLPPSPIGREQQPNPPTQRPTLRDTTVQIQAGRYGGSGVIVGSQNGKALVLTAQHVTAGGEPYTVTTNFGRYQAKLFGHNAVLDLAALIIEPGRELPAAPLAETEPRPGDPITLCGFGGGRWKELPGTVKGYSRHQTHEETDLVVSPKAISGDSGGPIYNARGEVVGILWGGPVHAPGQPLIHTQAVRPTSIDGWFEQKTGALAQIFGPHSMVLENREAVARLEAKMQGMGYSAQEISQLRADLVRLQGQVERNSQLAETARQLHAEWSPIRDDVIALVRNGLAPERQAILDAANAQAQRLLADQKVKDQAIIAAAEQKVAAAEAEVAALKNDVGEAKAIAVKAEQGVAEARVSILQTVANALGNYRDARSGGASPTEAGLATAEQVLREREREREANIIGAIQAGVQARQQGASGLSIAEAVLIALSGGGVVGGAMYLLRRRVAPAAGEVLMHRLLDRLGDKPEK